MKEAAANQFTHSHIVLPDGTVTFKCSADQSVWPWLALHPFDPTVVQTINYWASVEAGAARGTFDPTVWSALTAIEWTCGTRSNGHATHGVADAFGKEGDLRNRLTFFDADGELVYNMSGKGVVFKTRDFEGWRAKAKQESIALDLADDFEYAPAAAVGVATEVECYLAPLSGDKTPSAKALITKENGFLPGHPYQTGSGDHVNASHLGDVGRQFVNLLHGGDGPVIITSGDMRFDRYVELGRLFEVVLAEDELAEGAVSMTVHQAERQCAAIKLRVADK